MFQKILKEEIFPNAFYENSTSLTPKRAKVKQENFRVNCLMNVDAKISNETLTNQIQKQI